jgi:hypothetical protein
MPCPSHFTTWKETRYPSYWRLGGPQGQSRWVHNSPTPGFDVQTIKPIVIHHTNYAIPALKYVYVMYILYIPQIIWR